MELTPLTRSVRASDLPMEKLAANSQIAESEKVAEVSRQFEAVLLRQILQHAQKTHFKSSVAGEAMAGGIYQDLVTNQLADGISKSGGFGLAQTLSEQLKHELPSKVQGP